jgi:hypothetical protein
LKGKKRCNLLKRLHLWLEAAQENTVAIDHRLFADHQEERKNMQTFERLFADYKREFYEFVGTWL